MVGAALEAVEAQLAAVGLLALKGVVKDGAAGDV
jgi:hypothetical protein